jgi:hypothetical protein
MTLRVGFDLDGVLADMSAALLGEERRIFGTPDVAATAEAPREARSLTAAQHERLWREVATIENFWQTLPEVEPGAIAALAARARFERWEVIFLTSRPETAGDTAQLQTQRWLDVNGFDLPAVFVVSGSRGKIADALALDVVVDDLPENAMDVLSDSHAAAILFWRQPLERVPPGLRQHGCRIVGSIEECLTLLAAIKRDQSPTMLGRVKRALGLAGEV